MSPPDFDPSDFDSDDFDVGTTGHREEFYEGIHARSTDEVFIFLVTISHDDLAQPIYITNDTLDELSNGQRGVISNGIEFIYIPFQFVLPSLEKDSIPRAKISIDNITREIVAAVINIKDPPEIRIQIALSSDPDYIEYDLQGFKIATVTWDAITVEGELTVEQFFGEPYPAVRFTPSRFPGLFRGRSLEIGA